MCTYNSVTEVVEDLHKQGYVHDFRVRFDRLHCTTNRKSYHIDEFEIEERFRLKGKPGLEDSAVVYTVKGEDGAKGIMVEMQANRELPRSIDLVEKFRPHQK